MIQTAAGHFISGPLLSGPFRVQQIDFIQLSPSQIYKYVLVMIYIFSHWFEAFPCWHATALTVAKVLIEKIIPGVPRWPCG